MSVILCTGNVLPSLVPYTQAQARALFPKMSYLLHPDPATYTILVTAGYDHTIRCVRSTPSCSPARPLLTPPRSASGKPSQESALVQSSTQIPRLIGYVSRPISVTWLRLVTTRSSSTTSSQQTPTRCSASMAIPATSQGSRSTARASGWSLAQKMVL